MQDSDHLMRTFLAQRPAYRLPDDLLTELLHRCCEEAARAWPAFELPAERFVAHVAGHLPELPAPPWPRSTLLAYPVELYLTCACANQISSALLAFERSFLSRVPMYLGHLQRDQAFVEEVQQRLRERLLVSEGQAAPRIAAYAGQGPLSAWLRMAALRIGLNYLAEQRRWCADAAALDQIPAREDPDREALRQRYQQDFQDALRGACSSLEHHEIELLRLYYLRRLTGVDIAARYNVRQSTVSRWLAAVHTKLNEGMRKRLGLTPQDFESLIGEVRSQLHLSLARLAGEDGAPGV